MIEILSHNFTFETLDTSKESSTLNNILSITEEDRTKHFIQYMQYWTESTGEQKTLRYRQINIKVDRSYYLEVANISIDNIKRRRYLFSILGKRRFGANNKKNDYFLLNNELSIDKLTLAYKKNHKSHIDDQFSYTEKTNYSSNTYKTLPLKFTEANIVILNHMNCSNRKSIYKNYFVELLDEDFQYYNNISSDRSKVNYILANMGKIYFKSLDIKTHNISSNVEDIDKIASSMLKKQGHEIEIASRIDDNSLFRKLKDKSLFFNAIYKDIYKNSIALMANPNDENIINNFSISIVKFGIQTKDIQQLEEITSYFTALQMLAESGVLAFLFSKNDEDFGDIFIYMLESLTLWNSRLMNINENAKKFNIATVDLHDSLKYLVDVCFKFKHDYEIQNAREEKIEALRESENSRRTVITNITSAQKYFEEVELDNDSYEEISELDVEVSELPYLTVYDDV